MDQLRKAIALSSLGPLELIDKGGALRRFRFAEDFIGFSGHFPGYPVLPALAQITTALMVAEEFKGRSLVLDSVEKAKFMARVIHDQEVEVRCRECLVRQRPGFEAELSTEEGTAAKFLMILSNKVNNRNP